MSTLRLRPSREEFHALAAAHTVVPVWAELLADLETPVAAYASGLTPQVLLVRHYSEFSSMLSLGQIDQMLRIQGIMDRSSLRRHQFSRFAAALVNMLVLILTLPTFLLREPASQPALAGGRG